MSGRAIRVLTAWLCIIGYGVVVWNVAKLCGAAHDTRILLTVVSYPFAFLIGMVTYILWETL